MWRSSCTAPRCRALRGDAGFTLLELLVALALLALVSGAVYGTFFALTRGRDAASTGMEQRRELRATLDLLRRELTAALYTRENKRLHFVVEDRDYFGAPASTLDFTAIGPPLAGDAPVSDLQALRYQVVAREGRMGLGRRAADPYLTGSAVPYPQMEELAGFQVECYDGSRWVKSWDTSLNGRLPQRVRVTISVREGERTVAFTATATPRMVAP